MGLIRISDFFRHSAFGFRIFAKVLHPRHAGIFLLQGRLEPGIAVGFESRPIAGRLDPFAIGRAKPKLYREPPLANVRMTFERETFVEFDL